MKLMQIWGEFTGVNALENVISSLKQVEKQGTQI